MCCFPALFLAHALGGLDSEDSYPYFSGSTKKNGDCSYHSEDNVFKGTGWRMHDGVCTWMEHYDELVLTDALYRRGPVSVSIDAGQDGFHFYSGGVYYDTNCAREHTSHAVFATGYGVENGSGMPYYIVKNSWGTGWGVNGYINMARNQDSMCAIAKSGYMPKLERT